MTALDLDLNLDLAEVERVLVFRALPGLGDLLCAVPALRALRAALPRAHVAVLGLPWMAQPLARYSAYVDELIAFPGWPGLPEVPYDPERTTAFLADARARRWDLALQLHGSGPESNAFVSRLGARWTAGLHPPGQPAPDPARFVPFDPHEPEARRGLRLLARLGVPGAGEGLEFPLGARDEAEAARVLDDAGLCRAGFAALHPGASVPAKRWPVERFAAVADALAERSLVGVLTGTAGEREVTAAVGRAARADVVDLAGLTSLGGLGALLARARVVVTNDTGTSHLAAAVRTPSVVVFNTTVAAPARWAPLDSERHVALGAPSGDVPLAAVLGAVVGLLAH